MRPGSPWRCAPTEWQRGVVGERKVSEEGCRQEEREKVGWLADLVVFRESYESEHVVSSRGCGGEERQEAQQLARVESSRLLFLVGLVQTLYSSPVAVQKHSIQGPTARITLRVWCHSTLFAMHLIARSAVRSLRTLPAQPAGQLYPVRYLRSTTPSTPDVNNDAAAAAAESADAPPRPTQTGATPSASAVPPLNPAEAETPIPQQPQTTPADPTAPAPAPAAGQVSPPTDALSTRQNSIAEAFLDLHPDVAPRTEEELNAAGAHFPGDKTGAKARGAGKSSIEKKRANLARAAGAVTIAGLLWATYDLGKDWQDEEEAKKMYARSDDKQAIEEAEQGGWMGWWGRLKLRAADHLDVSAVSLFPCLSKCSAAHTHSPRTVPEQAGVGPAPACTAPRTALPPVYTRD